MTAVATDAPARDVPAGPAQRRLTVGLCVNVAAIAFESIAVATAMPAAARDLDGLSYYSRPAATASNEARPSHRRGRSWCAVGQDLVAPPVYPRKLPPQVDNE